MTDDDNKPDSQPEPITVVTFGTILSAQTGEGIVTMQLNRERTQMTIGKAREICGMLLAAIEAAVTDELLFTFLTKHVRVTVPEAAVMLSEFRQLRHTNLDPESVYPIPIKGGNGH